MSFGIQKYIGTVRDKIVLVDLLEIYRETMRHGSVNEGGY